MVRIHTTCAHGVIDGSQRTRTATTRIQNPGCPFLPPSNRLVHSHTGSLAQRGVHTPASQCGLADHRRGTPVGSEPILVAVLRAGGVVQVAHVPLALLRSVPS